MHNRRGGHYLSVASDNYQAIGTVIIAILCLTGEKGIIAKRKHRASYTLYRNIYWSSECIHNEVETLYHT